MTAALLNRRSGPGSRARANHARSAGDFRDLSNGPRAAARSSSIALSLGLGSR